MVQRRRSRNEFPRDRPVTVKFSAAELAEVEHAAETCGLARAAWIAKTAVAAARDDITPLEAEPYREAYQSVGEVRRELVAQGNNLNQIARHLNSGKMVPVEGIAEAVNYVLGAISRADAQMAELRSTIELAADAGRRRKQRLHDH